MAKKRKKKSTGRRSGGKRVRGASSTDAIYMVIGGIVGGLGMAYATNKVAFLQGKIMGLVEVALGGVLAWKVGHPFAKGLGIGVAIAGSTNAAKGFGILAGIGAPQQFRRSMPMAGFRDMPKVGAIPGGAFPKPGSVGKANFSNMYAGVYGG